MSDEDKERDDVDVSSIVPSTRDFLQSIATRRKRLALVTRVDAEDEARALSGSIAAIACASTGSAMRAIALAAGHTPVLASSPISSEQDALRARACGADAVLIDARIDASAFASLGKHARSTRMAAVGLAVDAPSAQRAAAAGVKAIFVRASSLDALLGAVAAVAPAMRVIAHLIDADGALLRSLVGRVDAALIEPIVHRAASFEALRAELDPD